MNFTRFFRRTQWHSERSRELQSYLQIETDENIARGLPPEEARYAAHRKLGNATLIREEVYIMNSIGFFETLGQDVRYALRMLRRNPAFSALAALSLALGIGGNAAMFSLVNGVLIQPLPYPDSGRLVRVTGYYPKGAAVALQERSRTMEIAPYSDDTDFNLTGHGEAIHLTGTAVAANLFRVLQATPELGRVFRVGEDRAGQDHLVLLSHSLWQTKFGGDPGVLGRFIDIDGVSRQVVGVMPPDFSFPSSQTQLWVPLHLDPSDQYAYWHDFMPLVARLRPGATLAQAASEVHSLIPYLLRLFPYPMAPEWNSDATTISLQQDLVGDVRARLLVLQCAVGIVLLIACANVAGLLLSRATVRQKEIALRVALGAGRGRIVRQLLTESLLLAFAGGAAGVALAVEGISTLKRILPAGMPGVARLAIDAPVLVFAAALAVLTGLAFGLIPALSASRFNLTETIKVGGQRSRGTSGVRLRLAVIGGEVALAVVLSVCAGLLIKSLWMLSQVNPGFQPEHILTARVSPDDSLCPKRPACVALYGELLRRAQSTSGVEDVAAANTVPLDGYVPFVPAEVEGHATNPAAHLAPLLWSGAVTPGYFRMMQIPVLRGRDFTDGDTETSAPVVVVSAATARHFWPGQDPIGKHIRTVWETEWRTVVGVVGDVHQFYLTGRSPAYINGAFYMPYAQSVDQTRKLPVAMTLLVRTGADSTGVTNRIRALVASVNPNVPVSNVETMDQMVNDSSSQPRSMMWLFVSFAAAALLLAAIGTYGVISYSTSQRTFEIGMRMALGASRGNIFSLVLGQSLKLVLAGLAAGVIAALAVTRMLSAFLYGIKATDPLTFLAVAALLLAIALLAGYVPARRAASVDPLKALRVD